MLLVDTNILVFVVIEGPKTTAARELLQHDSDWRTELIELSNAMAAMMRVRGLSLADAQAALMPQDARQNGRMLRNSQTSSRTAFRRACPAAQRFPGGAQE